MATATHESKTTANHDEIRTWVEERQGKPAIVKGTENDGSALLRISFPGGEDDKLENVSWDKFFDIFDKNDLKFLYQEKTKEGGTSRFFKFVNGD